MDDKGSHDNLQTRPPLSRYARQSLLLGLDKAEGLDANSAELRTEQLNFAAVGSLLPLDLPDAKPQTRAKVPFGLWPRVGIAFAAAAGALLCLHLVERQPAPAWQRKGEPTSLRVYYEKAGAAARALAPDERLSTGNKVRVEVSGRPGQTVVLMVVNRDGQLLQPFGTALARAQKLTSEGTVVFPGSLVLTGESEGERVIVTWCPDEAFANLGSESVRAVSDLIAKLRACSMQEVILRD